MCVNTFLGCYVINTQALDPKNHGIALGTYWACLGTIFSKLKFGPLKPSKTAILAEISHRTCVPVCAHTCSGVRGARSRCPYPQSVSEKKNLGP